VNIFTNAGTVATLTGGLNEQIRLEAHRDPVTRSDQLYIIGLDVGAGKETNVVKISMTYGKTGWKVKHVVNPREGEAI
jgi:hypothetical protein